MAAPDEPVRRLTDVNADIAAPLLGKAEMLTYTFEKFDQNGVPIYLPDFDPSKKYPLVLIIHGGLRAASMLTFSPAAQLMAAKGWLVFQPNYRGSDNLGRLFQTAITADAGAGPGRDVMAGIDTIKQRASSTRRRWPSQAGPTAGPRRPGCWGTTWTSGGRASPARR